MTDDMINIISVFRVFIRSSVNWINIQDPLAWAIEHSYRMVDQAKQLMIIIISVFRLDWMWPEPSFTILWGCVIYVYYKINTMSLLKDQIVLIMCIFRVELGRNVKYIIIYAPLAWAWNGSWVIHDLLAWGVIIVFMQFIVES
jgi:hypothetical protein